MIDVSNCTNREKDLIEIILIKQFERSNEKYMFIDVIKFNEF